ncbi:exodeoxyribonuclease VII large subunit [Bacillus sp. FJAT-47783]|uniref:exodeoxyribonuclease VII large subunit n=1 Tax=Bacillus sp. FJAT-47783 TaxID=2922712 RepID=UPI001FAC678F|nr:exodeoxyribonuclease VII large subunit [Bacillus sp. FJAT-47783]
MTELKYVTVTALTKYIKRKFNVDPHLQDIWVKGELSNVKIHSRGHVYFTLKDKGARIQAVMFASQIRHLKFRPEDGMKVLIRGEISVYEPSGTYQIYAKEMQPDGIGSLYLAYEELKRKLDGEGIFDSKHKKKIPAYPETVGVITSPTGAAIRDILSTIKRRYPICKVVLLPALVQGVEASNSIAKQIERANEIRGIDVLIVGRGGGSIEELWAFNEEIVARQMFKSRIPIISAVGHETDYTIADFVADLRAPTPTAAAELAVPNYKDLIDRITERKVRLHRNFKERIKLEKERLKRLQKSYAFKYPKQLYQQKEQQLDLTLERFHREANRYLKTKMDQLQMVDQRMIGLHPKDRINRLKEQRETLHRKLTREIELLLRQKQAAFQTELSKLNALSPLKVMERGYSLVYKENELMKSVQNVNLEDVIEVKMQDGKLQCEVIRIKEEPVSE